MPGPVELGASAHDQAMVQKVDEVAAAAVVAAGGQPPPAPSTAPAAPPTAPAPGAQARPENVPEKFWDASKGVVNTEALLKSYTELERAKSTTPATPPVPAGEAKPGDPPADPAPAPAAPPGKLDVAALSTEFAKEGKLSEQSTKALEAIGLDGETIQTIAAGQQALRELRDMKGMAIAGGEESFKSMAQWAATAYSDAEQEVFNKAVSKGSEAEMASAITALKARYEQANGRDPNLVHGGGGSGVGAFGSRSEITAAMHDPKYAKDPAYRAEVARRLELTDYGSIS